MTSPHPRATRPASALLRFGFLLVASTSTSIPVATADDLGTVSVPGLPAPIPSVKADRLPIERQVGVELPGRAQPPRAMALTCAAPQSSGVIQASHPYYDVFLDAGEGSFTARTGASHSVTALSAGFPQNVIFGGSGGSPGTSDVAWRFHGPFPVTYQDPGGGSACVFDPADTAMEPNSIGIEQEFTVNPQPGVTATLRQEIVAFGTTEENSGIRLTLGTTNWSTSSAPVNVGVRWQIDYQNAGDDGPWFATVTCDPPVVDREWSLEHELRPTEIRDFYRIQNNSGAPIFSNVSSTTAILGIPDTSTPDRLVFGRWGAMFGSTWDYVSSEGACCPDSDSAVLWYHGYLPADADLLAPGESSRHSVVIFSSADRVDCGAFIPTCASSVAYAPQDWRTCAGNSVPLDAGGITLTDCAGTVEYTWTDGVSTWSGPSIVVSPLDTTTYSVAVTCTTDAACRVDDAATVVVDHVPNFQPPLAADPDPCNNGIKLTWNPATFFGGSGAGAYNVYRSEISCADAELRPPIATGLTEPGFYDNATVAGRTYHYVVEAEDLSPGTTCSPTGPAGGSVTRLCSSAVNDALDENPPAGVGTVLFASHRGDQVRMMWPGLRPLLPGEHPHLLKARSDPQLPFVRVNADWAMASEHVEIDTSSSLQFFDLRVANSCERESLDDYPPGYDQ